VAPKHAYQRDGVRIISFGQPRGKLILCEKSREHPIPRKMDLTPQSPGVHNPLLLCPAGVKGSEEAEGVKGCQKN
jgi:hypothetical protein